MCRAHSDSRRPPTIKPLCIAGLAIGGVFGSFGTPPPARAQATTPTFTSDVNTDDGGTINISSLLGTAAFYNAGYTGSRAVVANIEGGLFYRYHATLSSDTIQLNYGGPPLPTLGPGTGGQPNAVNDPNLTNDPNWSLYDQHATAVAGLIAAAPLYSGDPRAGIAYGSTLVAGSISSGWIGSPYALSFNITDASFITPYAEAMQGGITPLGGRLTNVINGSYGFQDNPYSQGGTGTTGADPYTVALDGLAKASGATVVWAAGNNGYGNGNVNDPAAGYNGISVAALDYGNPANPYTAVAGFSSGGPSDYMSPTGVLVKGVRATVDIAAPGDAINTVLYNGATGGNTGATPPSTVSTNQYGSFDAGTSFAAPIVAGAATLIDDVGYDRFGGGDSVNGTVVKAVLMNSADRLSTWNNGQTLVNGVVTTSQALDYSVGSGNLNLTTAFTQYTANSGTDDISGGKVIAGPARGLGTIGWDYGCLNPSLTGSFANIYDFGTSLVGGTTFSATLTWDVDRAYNGLVPDSDETPTISSSDLRFTNLDLELWEVVNGVSTLVAISDAQYISTQEFSFFLPSTGDYYLEVLWAGDQYNLNNSDAEGQQYGLAWSGTSSGATSSLSAPEPASVVLTALGGIAAAIPSAFRRRISRRWYV